MAKLRRSIDKPPKLTKSSKLIDKSPKIMEKLPKSTETLPKSKDKRTKSIEKPPNSTGKITKPIDKLPKDQKKIERSQAKQDVARQSVLKNKVASANRPQTQNVIMIKSKSAQKQLNSFLKRYKTELKNLTLQIADLMMKNETLENSLINEEANEKLLKETIANKANEMVKYIEDAESLQIINQTLKSDLAKFKEICETQEITYNMERVNFEKTTSRFIKEMEQRERTLTMELDVIRKELQSKLDVSLEKLNQLEQELLQADLQLVASKEQFAGLNETLNLQIRQLTDENKILQSQNSSYTEIENSLKEQIVLKQNEIVKYLDDQTQLHKVNETLMLQLKRSQEEYGKLETLYKTDKEYYEQQAIEMKNELEQHLRSEFDKDRAVLECKLDESAVKLANLNEKMLQTAQELAECKSELKQQHDMAEAQKLQLTEKYDANRKELEASIENLQKEVILNKEIILKMRDAQREKDEVSNRTISDLLKKTRDLQNVFCPKVNPLPTANNESSENNPTTASAMIKPLTNVPNNQPSGFVPPQPVSQNSFVLSSDDEASLFGGWFPGPRQNDNSSASSMSLPESHVEEQPSKKRKLTK